MKDLQTLLENNRAWSATMAEQNPGFFQRLAQQQTPDYLWIGCADSRVPAAQLVGLLPGDMFVHRNVANVVIHTDLNCLAVLQYAVDVLKVQHVIVCGHYGCGGVQAALDNRKLGLIDNWLRHVQDVKHKHAAILDALTDEPQRFNRLCELNVIEQVMNVSQTTVVQSAWERGDHLVIHGWIYSIDDGLLHNLPLSITTDAELAEHYHQALAAIT